MQKSKSQKTKDQNDKIKNRHQKIQKSKNQRIQKSKNPKVRKSKNQKVVVVVETARRPAKSTSLLQWRSRRRFTSGARTKPRPIQLGVAASFSPGGYLYRLWRRTTSHCLGEGTATFAAMGAGQCSGHGSLCGARTAVPQAVSA